MGQNNSNGSDAVTVSQLANRFGMSQADVHKRLIEARLATPPVPSAAPQLGAQAYATGNRIFAPGGTSSELLSHELTHAVQQGGQPRKP